MRRTWPCPLALLMSVLAGAAHAQELAALDSIVPALMDRYDVPGAAVAVVRGDSLEALRAYGMARVADSVPFDAHRTVFRVASVAKLFVATAAVELAVRGELDLHRDVSRYIPDVGIPADYDEPITLHHLLTHTAGLDERLIGYAARSRDSIKPLGTYLAENLPHRGWPPGRVTGYSNHGMALAAYVVERVSGVPFHRYARDSLFIRLGMRGTSYLDVVDSLAAGRAVGHFCDEAGCVAADEVYSHPYPVGLAFSTAADMARFLLAQLNGGRVDGRQVLAGDAIALMQAQQFRHDAALPGMSYGFFNQSVRGGRRALSHAGNVPGMNSLLLLVPAEGVGIFFVANGGRSSFGAALRDSILGRVIPGTVLAAAPGGGDITLDRDHLEELAGPYQLTRYAHRTVEKFPLLFATTIRVRWTGAGRVVLPFDGGTEFEPIDSLRFREVDGERLIAFRRDEGGRVTHLFAGVPVFGSELPGALERRAWFDAADFKNEYVSYLLGVPVIILVIVWPSAALLSLWRRRRKGLPRRRLRAGPVAALAVALLFGALFALFGFGFIARSTQMFAQVRGIVYGMTSGMRALLVLPYLLGLLSLAVVAFSVVGWRRSYWGPARRLFYSLVALAAVLVVVFLVRWNYLPPVW